MKECKKSNVTLKKAGICFLFVAGVFVGGFVGGMFCGKPWEENDCTYSDWGNWSACHSQKSGENGTQFRVRNIVQQNGCSKHVTEVDLQSCSNKFIDCQYTDWGPWSPCYSQERRENGTQYRSRNILENDIDECILQPTFEEQSCEVEYCQYSDWGDWSECDGTQFRIRNVTETCGLCKVQPVEGRRCNIFPPIG